jgi:hypothetical protein
VLCQVYYYPNFTPKELQSEEWRPVVGYEMLYAISSLGRIKQLQQTHKFAALTFRKIGYTRDGYLAITLALDGKLRRYSVHRLVAAAFLGPCPLGYEVNHIDANKANPRPENLEYVTSKENKAHAKKLGLLKTAHLTFRKGQDSPQAKLTERDIVEIRRQLLKGIPYKAIAAQFNVTKMAISLIKRGKNWSHFKPLANQVRATIGDGWKTARSKS